MAERWRWVFSGPPMMVRALVVPAVIGYLLLLAPPPVTWLDWVFALGSAVIFFAAGRWPLTVMIGQAGLIVAAYQWGDTGPVTIKALASIALLETVVRRGDRAVVIGAIGLIGAYLIASPRDLLTLAYQMTIAIGGAVLLGRLMRQQRLRVRDAELRREVAERAARAEERTAIARELHDLMAHHMSSLALRVGVARHVVPDVDPRIATVLDDVHRGATGALDDLRSLIVALREPDRIGEPGIGLAAGLGPALEDVVDRARSAGLTVDLDVADEVDDLDPVRKLALVRIVGEALANTASHAGPGAAAEVEVAADHDGAVEVVVHDHRPTGSGGAFNGSGEPGYGLVGLRERVDLIGGRFEAGPAEDGWRVAALLRRPDVDSVGGP